MVAASRVRVIFFKYALSVRLYYRSKAQPQPETEKSKRKRKRKHQSDADAFWESMDEDSPIQGV